MATKYPFHTGETVAFARRGKVVGPPGHEGQGRQEHQGPGQGAAGEGGPHHGYAGARILHTNPTFMNNFVRIANAY